MPLASFWPFPGYGLRSVGANVNFPSANHDCLLSTPSAVASMENSQEQPFVNICYVAVSTRGAYHVKDNTPTLEGVTCLGFVVGLLGVFLGGGRGLCVGGGGGEEAFADSPRCANDS